MTGSKLFKACIRIMDLTKIKGRIRIAINMFHNTRYWLMYSVALSFGYTKVNKDNLSIE